MSGRPYFKGMAERLDKLARIAYTTTDKTGYRFLDDTERADVAFASRALSLMAAAPDAGVFDKWERYANYGLEQDKPMKAWLRSVAAFLKGEKI